MSDVALRYSIINGHLINYEFLVHNGIHPSDVVNLIWSKVKTFAVYGFCLKSSLFMTYIMKYETLLLVYGDIMLHH